MISAQNYPLRSERAHVNELKCSLNHRLGCEHRCKVVRYADKVVVLVCDEIEHTHDMENDRSKFLKVKYQNVLAPLVASPMRPARATAIWVMFEKELGSQEAAFLPNKKNKDQV